MIWKDAFFSYSLSPLSALIVINFSGLFSQQVKFYSFMFLHKISTQVAYVTVALQFFKRPFPSCMKPLFQSEAKCKTIDMKMSFILMQKSLMHIGPVYMEVGDPR